MFEFWRLQPHRPDRALHGYVYYRWMAAYVGLVQRAIGSDAACASPLRWAGRRFVGTHHAKVIPTSQARRLLTLDKPIELRATERVVPYRIARDVILASRPPIALAECSCRVAVRDRTGVRARCGPTDVCLFLGDPIAGFVARHWGDRARLVDPWEAVSVVEGAADRGHLHTLWFKDAAAGRMYAMCNCCRCCCTGLAGQRQGFAPLAPSGYVAKVFAERCSGCADCVDACVFGAMSVETASSGVAVVDARRCFGCGICVPRCKGGALGLESGVESAIEPLEL